MNAEELIQKSLDATSKVREATMAKIKKHSLELAKANNITDEKQIQGIEDVMTHGMGLGMEAASILTEELFQIFDKSIEPQINGSNQKNNMNKGEQVSSLANELGVRFINRWEAEAIWFKSHEFEPLFMSFASRDVDGSHVVFINPGEEIPFTDETVSEDQSYLASLHELGHQALGHVDLSMPWTDWATRVRWEEEAWEWALEHSLIEPSAEDMAYVMSTYGTYVDELERHASNETAPNTSR